MRRTVKSTFTAVVAGSLHSNKKSLSAELRRYQGFGADVTLLNLGFDVTDFNSLPLITNEDTPAEYAHPKIHAPSPVREVQNVSIRD